MGTISHLPRRDRPQPARLATEREAEAALEALLQDWTGSETSLAHRREALKLSGLASISLTAEAGGLDCPTALLAEIVTKLQAVDPDAAEALHRHFVLVEFFRLADDERFYNQLAEQTLAGDLLFCQMNAAHGLLDVRQEDFQASAWGDLHLPQAALWADWLWLFARNDAAGHMLEGAALVPVRSGIFESRADATGRPRLAARFRGAPVAHGLWGLQRLHRETALALDHLLEAARGSVRLHLPRGEAALSSITALRLDCALGALMALIREAAGALDHAQVTPTPATRGQALSLCRKAALFAADLAGDEARFSTLAEIIATASNG